MFFIGRIIFFLVLSFFLGVLWSASATAKPAMPAKIADLSSLWQIYNPSHKSYVYYDVQVGKSWNKPKILGFLLDNKKIGPYGVRLALEAQSCVYIGGKLVFYCAAARQVHIRLPAGVPNRPLQGTAQPATNVHIDTSQTWVLVYQPEGKINTSSLSLVNMKGEPVFAVIKQSANNILRSRVVAGHRGNNLIVVLCLGLGLMVLRHFFYRDFQQIIGFNDFLLLPNASSYISNHRIFTGFNVLLVFANIMGIGYILWDMGQEVLSKSTIFFDLGYLHQFSDLFTLLNVFLACCLYFLIKYCLIVLFGHIFDLQPYGTFHYYELIRSASRLHLALLICFLFVYLPGEVSAFTFIGMFKFFLFLFVFIRIIQISILLVKSSGFKYIYIFSYLCATEIFPLAFLRKFLV